VHPARECRSCSRPRNLQHDHRFGPGLHEPQSRTAVRLRPLLVRTLHVDLLILSSEEVQQRCRSPNGHDIGAKQRRGEIGCSLTTTITSTCRTCTRPFDSLVHCRPASRNSSRPRPGGVRYAASTQFNTPANLRLADSIRAYSVL